MDILYTIANKYDGEELKYSLRSLVNIPHDRVFVVGYLPRWLKNVIHIPTEQTGTKWENVPRNLRVACNDDRLSANFILMNDDFFILEPIKRPTKELNLNLGTFQDVLTRLNKIHDTPTNYMRGMAETSELIKAQGVSEPLSYEMHTPFIYNKKKLLKVLDLPGADKISCLQHRSLYGNLYLKGGEKQKDVKVFMRDGFLQPRKDAKFLSCDDAGFYIVQHYLFCKFPNKSIYEV